MPKSKRKTLNIFRICGPCGGTAVKVKIPSIGIKFQAQRTPYGFTGVQNIFKNTSLNIITSALKITFFFRFLDGHVQMECKLIKSLKITMKVLIIDFFDF